MTQEANDVQQLAPMLRTMVHTLGAAGIEDRPKVDLALTKPVSADKLRSAIAQVMQG